jgi:hypothetical protein
LRIVQGGKMDFFLFSAALSGSLPKAQTVTSAQRPTKRLLGKKWPIRIKQNVLEIFQLDLVRLRSFLSGIISGNAGLYKRNAFRTSFPGEPNVALVGRKHFTTKKNNVTSFITGAKL